MAKKPSENPCRAERRIFCRHTSAFFSATGQGCSLETSRATYLKRFAAVLVYFIVTGWLQAPAQAQISASAAFAPARVELGDTFALRILVQGTPVAPGEVDFSPWKALIPARNILHQSDWTRSGAHWVRQFTLIAFDSLQGPLPQLSVRLHLGDSVLTNAPDLLVAPVPASADLGDMEALRDIRREPAHWTDYWPWYLGALLCLGIALWYGRRRRPKSIAAPPPPPPQPATPPHEIALQKIAALEQEKTWKTGRLLEYYAALSLILREYLEKRYQIPALESTTREIAVLLQRTDFPAALKAPLDYLLQQADMTKFADMPPPPAYHEKALVNAREIVEKSRHS